jgi:hypothetical protein
VAALRADPAGLVLPPLSGALRGAARRLAEAHPSLPAADLRAATVVAGVGAVMASMRLLRVLPGLPFAPGHKNAVLLPLYLLAAELAPGRWAATGAGAVSGVVALLAGDGRLGPLELIKHILPGILADLTAPLWRGRAGLLTCALLGLLLALGRLGGEAAAMAALGGGAAGWAAFAAAAGTHLAAGVASALLAAPLLAGAGQIRAVIDAPLPTDPPQDRPR